MSVDTSVSANATYHPEHLADRVAMVAMRAIIRLQPPADLGPDRRSSPLPPWRRLCWRISAGLSPFRRADRGKSMLEHALKSANYDCVVIGGGLRLPPKSLTLFETVVNVIHKAAPSAAIAFNTKPEDTADAGARQLKAD
jgi:hypothetical protein